MPTQRFLVAAYNTGLQTDVKPFLLPEDAFSLLENSYVWRGRVKKRIGSALLYGTNPLSVNNQLYSRFRINVGTTNGSGALAGIVPGTKFKIGQMFSIANQLYTVYQTGTPAAMLNTGAGTGTYNTTTGAFSITGATAATTVYFYPAEPVMGFAVLDTITVNFERYIGFDTQFSYEYQASGGWERLATGAATWTGTDHDFFYSSNYRGSADSDTVLFTTNNTPSSTGDGIRYLLGNTWIQFTQSYTASPNTQILGARIVIPFKNRLLLLNTFEQPGSATTVQYQSRMRFSQFGNPVSTQAWYDFSSGFIGFGGVLDAPTQEAIISAQILRDRLIVYFEYSTWEIVYLNNEITPFRWQNINIELGAESTFSEVPFDRGIIAIGEVGIHTCNGLNVQRIDSKIPDQVFTIQNKNNGPERVQGIRDYNAELVYWTVPSVDTSNSSLVYPNQLIVYNYRNDSWSLWDDSITAFGYINLNNALTWEQITYYTWQEWTTTWDSGTNQSRDLQVLAGNQEGFTFYMSRDISRNSPSLQINNIIISGATITLSVTNNNLTNQSWILIENVQGTGNITNLNGQIYPVVAASTNSITIIDSSIGSGSYTGGGTLATVSQINMLTKQYNFFLDQGRNFCVNQIDFLVDRTEEGEITINMYPSSGNFTTQSMILETSPYPVALYPYEQFQDMLWHTLYPNANGTFVQLRLLWNPDQMIDPNISLENFVLNGMLFYANMTSSRLE